MAIGGYAKAAPAGWARAGYILPRVLAGVLLVVVAAEWASALSHPANLAAEWGGDFGAYRDAAARWVGGGPFYEPWQTAGPYHIDSGAILYPPVILALLVPFTVLPAFLWWVVPLGFLSAVVAYHRPAPWAWPLLVLPFTLPPTGWFIVNGTPTIWIAAFVALSTLRPWTGALVLVKPSVFPFALAGWRDPRWWATAAVLVALSLPMAGEYLAALRNSDGDLLYSLRDVPLLLVPVIARMSRQIRAEPPRRG